MMKNSYYYLIASFPMLQFNMKPPFSRADLLEKCRTEMSGEDMRILEKVSIEASEGIEDKPLILKEWNIFDRRLRNELARQRAVKKGKDPDKYIRGKEGIDPFIAPLAYWAINQDNPMESERYLDRMRWEKIEELKTGHYFDLEYLTAYSIQLQILERWDKINSGSGMNILQTLVEKI